MRREIQAGLLPAQHPQCSPMQGQAGAQLVPAPTQVGHPKGCSACGSARGPAAPHNCHTQVPEPQGSGLAPQPHLARVCNAHAIARCELPRRDQGAAHGPRAGTVPSPGTGSPCPASSGKPGAGSHAAASKAEQLPQAGSHRGPGEHQSQWRPWRTQRHQTT